MKIIVYSIITGKFSVYYSIRIMYGCFMRKDEKYLLLFMVHLRDHAVVEVPVAQQRGRRSLHNPAQIQTDQYLICRLTGVMGAATQHGDLSSAGIIRCIFTGFMTVIYISEGTRGVREFPDLVLRHRPHPYLAEEADDAPLSLYKATFHRAGAFPRIDGVERLVIPVDQGDGDVVSFRDGYHVAYEPGMEIRHITGEHEGPAGFRDAHSRVNPAGGAHARHEVGMTGDAREPVPVRGVGDDGHVRNDREYRVYYPLDEGTAAIGEERLVLAESAASSPGHDECRYVFLSHGYLISSLIISAARRYFFRTLKTIPCFNISCFHMINPARAATSLSSSV